MSDALINALSDFWAYQQRRPIIIKTGVQALHRLIPIALSRTATGKAVGRFLLGLYDGVTYRFDLKQLHRLAPREFEDCLQVLEMDYMPEVEVHERVEEGENLWRELIELWRSQPLVPVHPRSAPLNNVALHAKHRAPIEAKGIEAFDHLLQVAERGTHQSRIVGMFLMSLIYRNHYRFNLSDLRGLDIKLFEHCISVLRMDYFLYTQAGKP
ncbi:hypothetical protein HU759_027715 [Pseudomonas sp. OE 28.3]|uniref:DUF7673 family protein n=1 Tax=Pseudomonas sp. OE 28.3 TaxID=2745519 RepID=UPI0016492F8A|nr:hypothetical protein [Pseudomonas sp. OE 28.3]QXI58810.1 hypothetical protein HU759_027715 [Pseudomonas sp. OE 28.3]